MTLIGMILLVIFMGCSKDRAYETVYKESELAKLSSDAPSTEELFLYVPSSLGAPREVVYAQPFFQGDEKLVKFKFTKDALQVLELEKDSRFQDNQLNEKPVLSIPVSYKSFRCKENAQDECTQEEEENTEIEWHKKDFFLPDFANLQVNEVNTLDLFNISPSCISEVGSKLVDYEMSKGILNIEIERSFKVAKNSSCILPLYFDENMSSAGFKMRFFYSMVRLSDLASKDYVSVDYPTTDHSRFGFFKVHKRELDEVYDPQREKQSYLLNRWNPNKKTIPYHLSASFNKPENKILKDATFKAVDTINQTLKEAQAGIEINLIEHKDGEKEKQPGDLRHSMIVLVDDPLSNGLLGYGPSVSNPLTGEILQARTNMYGGVLRSTIRSIYESMVDLSIKAPIPAAKVQAVASKSPDKHDPRLSPALKVTANDQKIQQIQKNQMRLRQELLTRMSTQYRPQEVFNSKDEELKFKDLNSYEDKISFLSKNNAYSVDLVNVVGLAKFHIQGVLAIQDIKTKEGKLKRWDELNEKQKTEVVNQVLPETYISTLVHEIGHNLGLRHNFTGSFDKANFYTKDELAKKGLSGEPAYSSIMDYGYSELNQLKVFGKYDLAALRFAYARQVEVTQKDGKTAILPVKTNLADLQTELKDQGTVKRYLFCTDENVGLSVECERFDEGTSISQIAKHYQDRYLEFYRYRNLRDGRNEFSIYGVDAYASSRYSEFSRVRGIFESWEFYASFFGNELMEVGCNETQVAQFPICKDINDRRDAVKIAAKMLLDIIGTPDKTCAVAKAETPTVVSELKKLEPIYEDIRFDLIEKKDYQVPMSCFHPAIMEKLASEGLVVVADGGKYLNSLNEPNPQYVYSSDIAVRGVWVDKLMAMHSLVTRQTNRNATEEIQGSFLDIQSISQEFSSLVKHLTIGEKLASPISFKDINGNDVAVDYQLSMDDIIPEQPTFGVIRMFGLPLRDNVRLNQQLLKVALHSSNSSDITHQEVAKKTQQMLSVKKLNVFDPIQTSGVKSIVIDDKKFLAIPSQSIAFQMLSELEDLELLDKISPDEIIKSIETREGPLPLPDDLTPTDLLAINFAGIDFLKQMISIHNNPNFQLTLEMLTNQFGAEVGQILWDVYNLGAIRLAELVAIVENIDFTPADASDDVKKLYQLDLNTVKKYLSGELAKAAQNYPQILDLLPEL